jgi:hypothetical protein
LTAIDIIAIMYINIYYEFGKVLFAKKAKRIFLYFFIFMYARTIRLLDAFITLTFHEAPRPLK